MRIVIDEMEQKPDSDERTLKREVRALATIKDLVDFLQADAADGEEAAQQHAVVELLEHVWGWGTTSFPAVNHGIYRVQVQD